MYRSADDGYALNRNAVKFLGSPEAVERYNIPDWCNAFVVINHDVGSIFIPTKNLEQAQKILLDAVINGYIIVDTFSDSFDIGHNSWGL